jgi:hypothetical protein
MELGMDVGEPRASDELAKSLRTDFERHGAVLLKSIDFKPSDKDGTRRNHRQGHILSEDIDD